jgi:SAM-dependent methyltransferase
MYGELSELWPFVSPPESYVEEVATFRTRFRRHGVADGARVLHLGSGGGSIDYHLKQTYKVTGVDISPAMIAYARRINPEVEYIEGDIRTVRLGRAFDAVLVHDAISYMTSVEELEMVYATAAAHLGVGGVMVALPEEIPARVIPDEPDAETRSVGDRVVTLISVDYDENPADHRFETVYIFLIREGGQLRVEVDRHAHGVFQLQEFLGAMSRSGFEPEAERWELSDWKPGQEMPLVTAVRRR